MRAASRDFHALDLDRKILDFMASESGGDPQFERLALELFAYQYQTNVPYQSLCNHLGRTPRSVTSWKHIPAVSVASFGDVRLACFPPENARLRFLSSGTTSAGSRRSVHEFDANHLYDASLRAHFQRCVMPDRSSMPMLMLSPPFEEAPESSLAYMLSKVFACYANGGGFFIRGGKLDSNSLICALSAAHEPVLVFGTALALAHFLEICADQRLRFSLPAGSRLVETGGFKGQSRSIERADLYASLSGVFGVAPEFCISEYGMCELGSQWYDANLQDVLEGKTPRYGAKIGPHWTRILVVEPVSGEVVPDGEIGLLRVFDLSNRGSVAAVLTGDLVRKHGEGFIYVSRSPAAPPKGCSITTDSILRSYG